MKEEPGKGSQDDPAAPEKEERRTWVGQQLGDDWIEIEPGIYRFCGSNEPGIRTATSAETHADDDLIEALDDLIEALQPTDPESELQPTDVESEPSKPTRRRWGRRTSW